MVGKQMEASDSVSRGYGDYFLLASMCTFDEACNDERLKTRMKNYIIVLKGVCLIALVGYIWYTLDTTVLGRSDYSYYRYKTYPFWSYAAILSGEVSLIRENLLNVALFAPIGLLLCCLLPWRKWWIALMFGFELSVCIELLQLVWKRGTCEFDDVLHNTLGCLLGFILASGIAKFYNHLRWRN